MKISQVRELLSNLKKSNPVSAEKLSKAMVKPKREAGKMEGKKGAVSGKRADLGGQYFRSKWEANYARYLNWLVAQKQIIGWLYEPYEYDFGHNYRQNRFYKPDFKITTIKWTAEYHEVKGWLDSDSKIRLKRMAKHYPSVKILLIQKKEMREIKDKVAHLIPNWEY